ncbi:MmpS family transport accessory protein [Planotetraspora sp. GP83]|uniref:MmpS family transport accessory protein n=1 Tax=Planotetraspora sp. GP83 TaxID=3156264 RepID=UPI0035160BBB
MAYQHGPQDPRQWQTQPGQQPYGPPPGYGYPPQPPKKTNVGLILAIIAAVLILLFGGCAIIVNASGHSGTVAITHTVVFEVAATGGATAKAADLTYGVGLDTKEQRGVTLPYAQSVKVLGVVPRLSLQAQASGLSSGIKCRITVDGAVVREMTANTIIDRCDLQVEP